MKRILNIFISAILILTVVTTTVSAGDENNPEIQDEENDIIGTLIQFPILFQLFQRLGVVSIHSFEFMDITKAWFYEDENEPDYLFVALKNKDLYYTPLRAIYAIRWTYHDKNYGASCHTYSNGEFKWFAAGQIFGLFDNWAYKKGLIQDISGCTIDTETNIMTFKVPKSLIGNPQPGDKLTVTSAWTGLRFVSEIFTYPFGGELAKDPTSPGAEYTIEY